MAQWLYLVGFLLVVIGCIKFLAENADKSEKERKAKSLLSKSERLGNIADNLSKKWKS